MTGEVKTIYRWALIKKFKLRLVNSPHKTLDHPRPITPLYMYGVDRNGRYIIKLGKMYVSWMHKYEKH